MLTVMCPNCRHRFPAEGCCEPDAFQKGNTLIHPTPCYYGGLLVPRGFTSGGGCFINAPTIIHNQPIIQPVNQQSLLIDLEKPRINKPRTENLVETAETNIRVSSSSSVAKNVAKNLSSGCQIVSSCDLTGESVTITTPSIQSGGCLIQSKDSGMLMHGSHVEILPKFSGGGCFVQKHLSSDHQEIPIIHSGSKGQERTVNLDRGDVDPRNNERKLSPDHLETGNANERQIFSSFHVTNMPFVEIQTPGKVETKVNEVDQSPKSTCRCSNPQSIQLNPISTNETRESRPQDDSSGLEIHLNATVQLPASLGQCTVNITATRTPSQSLLSVANSRNRYNFNGGGLVQENRTQDNEEREERAPTTPVSWLMPCPWNFDSYLMDRGMARLVEVTRLLQCCGWYHEGLSWQQSESLLKNSPVGRWLMRDSSDSRYMFAVSVQTARGPTSVRVHYFLGRFQLDAEPRLAFAMPLFDCPIKMLEYYVDYTKTVDEGRKQVWVDHSGQIYSQIYLTKPLVKEVRSLSHLARLVVNRSKLKVDHLPIMIRNYLAEYPYSL